MKSFFILCCLLGKAAADSGNDFVNNLFTDLAPLLALFGERVTQQFMSQSTGWADHILLSMAPLGIVTAIVAAIRVGGPPWLKAIIGRARENFAVVESELLSSTSNEVCEVWNGREIVRIMGKPPIAEFICLVRKNEPYLSLRPGKRMNVKFMTMDDAIKQGLIKRHCKDSELSDVQKKAPLEPKATSLGKLWRFLFLRRENGAVDEEAARDDSSADGRGPSIRGRCDEIGNDASSNLPDGPSTAPIGITSAATGVRAEEPEAFESCHGSLPALSEEEKSSPHADKSGRESSKSNDYSNETEIGQEKDDEWKLLAAIESGRREELLERRAARRNFPSRRYGRIFTSTSSDNEVPAAVKKSRFGAESWRTAQEPMSESPSARSENMPSYESPEPAIPPVTASISEVSDIVVIRNSHHTIPNISMNCHKSFRRGSLRLAAGFATLLQIILIIYSSGTVYYWRMKPDGKPVRSYGFPFAAGGSMTLVAGMMVCAHVVESYTKEIRYTVLKNRMARMIWLQQRQKVGEQVFDSCALYPPDAQEIIITSGRDQISQPLMLSLERLLPKLLRKVKENAPDTAKDDAAEEKESDSASEQEKANKLESLTMLEAKTFLGVTLALLGFFFQFTGIRALHWSVALTQLGAVGILTILRVWVRRGFSKPPVHYNLIPGHELDWLAVALQHSDTLPWRQDKTELHSEKAGLAWGVATGSDLQHMHGSTSSTCLNWEVESSHGEQVKSSSPCEDDDRLDAILPLRRDLAQASDWNGPLSPLAIKLAESLDAVMDLCFPNSKVRNTAQWDILLSPQKNHGARYARFHIRRENGRWRNQSDEIDAALSLWIFSVIMVYQWPTRQKNMGLETDQETESGDSWLRRKGALQKRGLQIIGRATESIIKDMDWWIPVSTTQLVEVRPIGTIAEGYIEERSCTQSSRDVYIEKDSYKKYCVTGRSSTKPSCFSLLNVDSQRQTGSFTDTRRGSIPDGEQLHGIMTRRTSDRTSDIFDCGTKEPRRFKQLFQSAIIKQRGKPSSKTEPQLFLALNATDSLDRMYARELLAAFIWAVAEKVEDSIPGEVTVHRSGAWSEQVGRGLVSKTGDLEFDIEVRHSGLSKMMEEIHARGFASPEQVHCLTISPLSCLGKLPDVVPVVQHMEAVARTLSSKPEYSFHETILHLWLFYSCSVATITPTGSASVQAVAAAIEHHRRLTDDMRAMLIQGTACEYYEPPQRSKQVTEIPMNISADYRDLVDARNRIQEMLTLAPPKVLALAEATKAWHRMKWCLEKEGKELQNSHYLDDKYRPHGISDRKADVKAIKDVSGTDPVEWFIFDQAEYDGRVETTITDMFGWSVLHHIASGRRLQLHGTYKRDDFVQIARNEDLNGWTPLHYACCRGHRNLAEGLMKLTRDVNHAGRDGRTPLHCAVQNNRLAVAKKLIDYGAVLDRLDKTGNSPIFWAAYKGHNEMFRFLFPLANIRRLCNGGRTLLHAAVIGGSRVIARMIGEDGRLMIDMTAIDEASMTALEYAVANEDVKMVRYLSTLLEPMLKGSRALDKAIVATIKRDRSIQISRETGSDRFENDRVKILRVLLLSLDEGSPQVVDAMIEAIRANHSEVVLLLIRDFKCQVDTKSSAGEYPIHVAVKEYSDEIVKILVEDGKASLDKKDENGKTALECAIEWNCGSMVGHLCRIKAEVAPDSLILALKIGNFVIAQQLLELGVEVDDGCFEAIKKSARVAAIAKLTKVLKNFQERNNGRARREAESGLRLEDSESLDRKEAGSG
ncbi:Serine/threonine-protein phosphatase 6 regulatory ankyrin repeat subunit B [Beauveria bassiana]|nr:Serine/threonine-protein phosphatase 6 regulatory ankyrin repeat subunit B [Beauveria bassiana]KAH8713975.1 Serine/threonine-protein phosphatase 6 regulatory ankyrin repeat subunit B [Beauveria bassiana]